MPLENLFPISLNLNGRQCLVLGGGTVSLAKVKPLLAAGAFVRVVAVNALPEFAVLEKTVNLELVQTRLEAVHCNDVFLAIDSGECPNSSPLLRSLAASDGFLLNSVDQPEACDYFTPAVVRRGPVQIAISTGGAAPALARNVRQMLEHLLPQNLGTIVHQAGAFRERAKSALDRAKQRIFWDRVFSKVEMKQLAQLKDTQIFECFDKLLHQTKAGTAVGKVTLVGAGAGGADMISLRGLRALEEADVILHDALLDPALLSHARRDAHIMAVGKRCGKHSATQTFINRTLANFAKQGNRVVRLKCGDPFIFGRGGEELQHLNNEGIETQVIAGVSAAAVAAADACIPLTGRGTLRRVTYMTGSTNAGLQTDRANWQALLTGGSVALYMARRHLAKTMQEIMEAGISPNVPVTIVVNAGLPKRQIIEGTVASISNQARHAASGEPCIFLVGAYSVGRSPIPLSLSYQQSDKENCFALQYEPTNNAAP